MPVEILCPDCNASYSVVDENLGRMGRCKHCGSTFPLVPHTRDGGPSPSTSAATDLASKPLEPVLPESFGRYKIVKLLGRGGMGSVYLARDTQLKRQVALKVPHIVAFADRPDVRVRFFREAEAAARFHHPNFCPIHDIGEVDGVPFLTMAFIEGKTLSAMIEWGQGWPSRKAAKVARQLAVALAELHRQGIVHRDLKPANIMLDARGLLVIMDFGLARWFDEVDSTFTPTGAILGTPAYMPPEQAEGNLKAIGPRSDVYSLGVILYELLTGRRPFEGGITKVLGMIAYADPSPPSDLRPGLEPQLEAICLKAMAKKPENRYASMDEFARALQTWIDSPSTGKAAALANAEIPTIRDEKPEETIQDIADRGPKSSRSLQLVVLAVIIAAIGCGLWFWATRTSITNSVGMTLRLIPAGEFWMGSGDTDPGAEADEKPRHEVRITRPFYLGTTEVTVGQFRRFVDERKYQTEAERENKKGNEGSDESRGLFAQNSKYNWREPGFEQTDDHPVVNVTWNDAMEFCTWLSGKEGQLYRLPTEAEWEYACRAGTTTKFSVGDEIEALALVGNVADGSAHVKFPNWSKTIEASDGYVFTAPVAKFRPNPWGLYDMHGNVCEWCSDWRGDNYYASLPTPAVDPVGPTSGSTNRVIRGGSWYFNPITNRTVYRNWDNPQIRRDRLGFRVVRVQ